LIRRLQRDIRATLATVDRITAVNLRDLLARLDEAWEAYTAVAEAAMSTAERRAIRDGSSFFVEPLLAAGVSDVHLFASPAQVNALTGFSVDLISAMSQEAKDQIVTQIRLAALGEVTPFEAMQRVTKVLGITGKKQIVRGVTARSERIVRTELNRAFNVANDSQMLANVEAGASLQKRWIATGDHRTRDTHIDAHGQIVDIDEKFTVGKAKLAYPIDPTGPASEVINCRCRVTAVHPDVGVIKTPLEASIGREIKRREKEKEATRKK